jgi:hypothetical protein
VSSPNIVDGQYDTKATNPENPKDRVAGKKLPFGLIPSTALIELELAFLEGALKYGRYNWRVAGVSTSVYRAAMERHMRSWWEGENVDPSTKIKHLGNLMACCAILIDAEACSKLHDDRPPSAPVGDMIRAAEERVAHLKELFKDFNPKQYTIADTPCDSAQ